MVSHGVYHTGDQIARHDAPRLHQVHVL